MVEDDALYDFSALKFFVFSLMAQENTMFVNVSYMLENNMFSSVLGAAFHVHICSF